MYIIFKENNMYEMKGHRLTLLYNLHNSVHPTRKIFATDMYNLCERYRNHQDLEKWNLRKPLLSVLNRLCGPFIEYCATPLQVIPIIGLFYANKEDKILVQIIMPLQKFGLYQAL